MSDTVTLEYLGTPAPDRRRAPMVVAGVIGLLGAGGGRVPVVE